MQWSRYILVLIAPAVLVWAATDKIHAAVIPAEEVRTAIIDHIEKLAEESGAEIEATVPRVVDIEIENVNAPVMNVYIPPKKNIGARTPVRVEFSSSDGKVIRRFQFSARVKVFKTVAVVRSDMKRGEPFTENNIEMAKADVTGLKNYYEDISLLEGMQCKRILRTGTVLTKRIVCPVPLIRRGDKVTIEARAGNVIATAEGTARQDGRKGDTIRVYNGMTRKILKCRVLGDKKVETGFY